MFYLNIVITILFYGVIFLPNFSYAENYSKATVHGCVDPGGSDGIISIYVKDKNDPYKTYSYEIAKEEIDDSVMNKLYDSCNCNNDNICKMTITYTTDENDFEDKGAIGLVRKFNTIKPN